MKRIVGLILAGLLAGTATAQMPAQAWEPYSQALLARATGGETAAQFALAEAFRTGNGTAPDRDQAIAWYRRCASIDTRAADALGVLLFTKGERKAAIPILQMSAGRRNVYALYILGTARFNGDYVPRDLARAYADMRLAAQTLPQAQRSLAMMEGYVGPDDKRRADQLAASPDGPEAGALAAPDYALAAPPSVRPAALVTTTAPKPVKKPRKAPASVPTDTPSRADAAAVMPLPPPAFSPPATIRTAGPVTDGMSLGTATIDDPAPTPPPTKPAPRPKPVPRVTRSAAVVTADTAPPAHPRPTAAAATGTWRVQLGAYGSEDRATTQWKALVAKVPALAAYRKTTEPAGTVVRLQAAGLPSKDAATALCKSVTDGGGACFVVPQ